MPKHVLPILLLTFAFHSSYSSEKVLSLLRTRGADLIESAGVIGDPDGPAAFSGFIMYLSDDLQKAGDVEEARLVEQIITTGYRHPDLPWIVHTFAREFYREEIIRRTGDLIRFRTYATDVPNRHNPEFIRQKEYLRSLALELGLNFNDVGGYVQEIWIGEAEGTFGIMSHSDVQPVEVSQWAHDPWSGEIINGSIWGRGSVDDKGPIVAVMYGMRALLDSGFPLRKKIILLIGTDEESANEDVSTYLKTNKAPDQTIVVDSNFPVVCAEKGWGGIWLHLPRGLGNPEAPGLRIVDLRSGFSPSIVPESAVARLVPDRPGEDALSTIEKAAGEFEANRPGSDISVRSVQDTIIIETYGESVHSSVPANGHNALMDMLVFLDRDLKPVTNEYSLMARFATKYIGFELDGTSLGIAHRDDFMGEVTVAGNMFSTTDSTVMFMFNFRRPKGTDRNTVVEALESRFAEFGAEHGVKFTDTRYIGDPLYNDPNGPFVQRLLGIYNRVTGETREAQSIGGGTYAHRIPNAVVFGPALPDEEYLGHQPDEHLKISTLIRNIEILTHTMVDFGM